MLRYQSGMTQGWGGGGGGGDFHINLCRMCHLSRYHFSTYILEPGKEFDQKF